MERKKNVIFLTPELTLLCSFLLPQPTALLLGTSWWSEPLSTSSQPSQNEASPLISISMSTDPGPRPPLDPIWLTNSGALLSPTTTPPVNNVQPIIAGRAIAKTLAINLPVEFSKLSTVHALVTIVAPGSEEVPLQERLIGTFKSKPISIISKPPSKARVVDIKTGGTSAFLFSFLVQKSDSLHSFARSRSNPSWRFNHSLHSHQSMSRSYSLPRNLLLIDRFSPN